MSQPSKLQRLGNRTQADRGCTFGRSQIGCVEPTDQNARHAGREHNNFSAGRTGFLLLGLAYPTEGSDPCRAKLFHSPAKRCSRAMPA